MKLSATIFCLLFTLFILGQTEVVLSGGIQDNDTTNNNVLSDAISLLNNEGTISIKGNIFINDNFTIPEGIELKFFKSNMLIIANGVVLTIDGNINARQYQIFDIQGIGSVTGNSCTNIGYPEWFGAVGNGIANDENAITNALNFSSQINWDGIYYSSTNIIIKSSCFNIYKLKLKNTSLIIESKDESFLNNTINNLSIVFDSLSTDTFGLQLKRIGTNSRIRDMLINDVYIENCDKAIYANANDKFHSLGTIQITNSVLKNNNYSVFFDENDDNLPTTKFASINDIIINDNVFYSNIKDIYMKSSDGVIIANNTFFGNSGNKTKSIHIGDNLSDQIKIHNNQIFEPQEEGILIDKVKSFQISNNNIVTTNNLIKLSPRIKLRVRAIPAQSTIVGNVIRQATTNGIEIIDDSQNKNLLQSIFVNSNVIYTKAYDTIHHSNGTYTLLSEIDHYGITYDGKFTYLNGTNHSLKEERGENDSKIFTEIGNFDIQNQIERRNNFSKYPSGNIVNKTITFPDSNSTELLNLKGVNEDKFSFFLKVHCWFGDKKKLTDINNPGTSSTYLLLISKSLSNLQEVAVISELGYVDVEPNPDTWISPSWPAFNFSVQNNKLIIEHKNGNINDKEFSFEIIKIGNGKIN
ncbi:right-handed parallel beta-helix repeat-containing protein [Winogradskyella luteola]|uniref:Right handed beta helix domain-containing protein n=1 Tax=Winogradskyella luteola TaxID=2828330 RepID=A0A9X1JRC9_9FLAO|nr:right-handed parallel beta-helix repeat-containing protein [Winogradskyella luteola]MBV7268477.1 hypothetical protein [Winogradskyella luteola]